MGVVGYTLGGCPLDLGKTRLGGDVLLHDCVFRRECKLGPASCFNKRDCRSRSGHLLIVSGCRVPAGVFTNVFVKTRPAP